MRLILIGVLVLLLAVPTGAGPSKQPGPPGAPSQAGGPPGQGWGPYAVKGTVTAINTAASTLTLQVEGALEAHGNPNAPGQRKKISTAPGTAVTVRVIPGQTFTGVGRRNTVPFSALQVGDRVQVWGATQADGTVAAVRIQLLGRAHGPLPAGTPIPGALPPGTPATPGTVHGVIVGGVGGTMAGTLTIVTDAGTTQIVTLTSATAVTAHGVAAGPGALHSYDIVRATGTASGSTLAASAIDVEFDSSTGVQVAGPIGLTVAAIEGITVGATIVGVHPDTFILQGTTRLSFSALTPGRSVTVYGAPVNSGPLSFGIQARVVVVQ